MWLLSQFLAKVGNSLEHLTLEFDPADDTASVEEGLLDFNDSVKLNSLRSLTLFSESGDPSLYQGYLVRAIQKSPHLSKVIISTPSMQADATLWGRFDEAIMDVLGDNPRRNFTLCIQTRDIDRDRVKCPLMKCVCLGAVRLVDVKVMALIRAEMEQGPISRVSWVDRWRNEQNILDHHRIQVVPGSGYGR